jgi:hypothetical protein
VQKDPDSIGFVNDQFFTSSRLEKEVNCLQECLPPTIPTLASNP